MRISQAKSLWLLSFLWMGCLSLHGSEEQTLSLSIGDFKAPNSKAGEWTEFGSGSGKVTYTHSSGVEVTIEAAKAPLKRTKDGLGIKDPFLDFAETLKIRVAGIQGDALISELRFAHLTDGEELSVLAPSLSFFLSNGGRIGGGLHTTARNNDGPGVSVVGGTQADPSKVCVVAYRGPNQSPGFPLSPKEEIQIKARAESSMILAGIRLSAIPFPVKEDAKLQTTERTARKADWKDLSNQEDIRVKALDDGSAMVTVEAVAGTARSYSGITFELGSSTFEGKATMAQLANLVKALKQSEGESFLIEGHTCDLGSEEGNRKLSEERAEAVKAHLVKNGIEADRIVTLGFGESEPVAENTEETRHLNRRVVIYRRKGS